MQKIPTLFLRDPQNPKRVTETVNPECQWVLDGEGVATTKWDGTACSVIDGALYKRHQHKAEKGEPPAGWIHWSRDPSQQSGHGWLPCTDADSSARYHMEAWRLYAKVEDGTYELVGPKVQGNPYGLNRHELWRHGVDAVELVREFTALAEWLKNHAIEGIVWHHPDGRMAKIKARDFGISWPR